MTDGVEGITSAALALALDAASLRQRAAAANIANTGTEGYEPVQVSFEDQLGDARATLETGRLLDAAALSNVRPAVQLAPSGRGGLPTAVQLDLEVAGMARNAAQYQALVKGLSRHYALLAAAVSEGKK